MGMVFVFLSGVLVLPVGFFLTLLVIRLLDTILSDVEVSFEKKCKEVDPYSIDHVASGLTASTTGYVLVKFFGWRFCIFPPKFGDKPEELLEIEESVYRAVLKGLEEIGITGDREVY